MPRRITVTGQVPQGADPELEISVKEARMGRGRSWAEMQSH